MTLGVSIASAIQAPCEPSVDGTSVNQLINLSPPLLNLHSQKIVEGAT
jgi:hypothetical protein